MKSIHSEGGGRDSKEFLHSFLLVINILNKALFQTVEKIRFQRVCSCIQCRQEEGGKRQKQGGQSCKTNHKCGEIVENQSTAKKCGVKFLENCLNPAHTGCFFTGPPLKS